MSHSHQEENQRSSSSWTSRHHLVGNKTTYNLLISASSEFDNVDIDSYIMSNESVEATSFQQEDVRDRKPALWRTCVPHRCTSDRPAIAIDLVAADWQQDSKKEIFDLPTKHIQEVATERLTQMVLDHVYEQLLPDLILKAALEEVRVQYLRSALAETSNGSKEQQRTTTSSKASWTNTQTPPQYYTKNPNSYLRPPELTENGPSTATAAATVLFTPNNLTNRIKAGCALAWSQIDETRRPTTAVMSENSSSDRRASSRIARITTEQKEQKTDATTEDVRYLWGVIPGGTIASFLLDTLMPSKDVKEESNLDPESNERISVSAENGDSKLPSNSVDGGNIATQSGVAIANGKGADYRDKQPIVDREKEKSNDLGENGEVQQLHSKSMADVSVSKDSNPYMQPSAFALLEWLGRKTAKHLSNTDLQQVFPSLVLQRQSKKKKKDVVRVASSGRMALPLVSSIDKQIWQKAISPVARFDDVSTRLVLESQSYEDVSNIDGWETSVFARANFSLRILDDSDLGSNIGKPVKNFEQIEKGYKDRKAWEMTRFKAIHSGYTIWSSWLEAVQAWKKRVLDSTNANFMKGPSPNGSTHYDDLAIAQALSAETDPNTRRRTTRRGKDSSGVFYGDQSGLTIKQLMETLLRMISQEPFQSLPDLLYKVPDESTDPLRRMRNAVGRLVWKRKQMSQIRVNTEWTDPPKQETVFSATNLIVTSKIPSHAAEDVRDLLAYIMELHRVELQLRRLLVSLLTRQPISLVASAGDDRPGTLETADNDSFQEPANIQWQSTGHDLVGSTIYRPPVDYNIDGNARCQWFRIESYTPSVASDPERGDSVIPEKPQIGSAKDNIAVDRRARFYAVPIAGGSASLAAVPLVLTEAQVFAGIKAAELQNSSALPERFDFHPFTGEAGARVALLSLSGERHINGEVVGWDSTSDEDEQIQHRILVLPERGHVPENAFWAALNGSEQGGFTCTVEGRSDIYTVQQFDYHVSSQAFKECRAIVGHLQRHSKASPFLEPVDPSALNIPNYFDIIKHPMDIRTLSDKLERGEYSNMHPKEATGRSPVSKMLNGPFRRDVELIFDNAITFNPPDDWIYQAAVAMKKFIVKKIEQVSAAADESIDGHRSTHTSSYVEYDSDIDMYIDESDKDDDYAESQTSRKRKEPRAGWSGEDTASKAIERQVKLQNVLGDAQGLRPPLSHLPINSNPVTFSLSSDWKCKRVTGSQSTSKAESDMGQELSELLALHSTMEERQALGARRSTRSNVESQVENGSSGKEITAELIFTHNLMDKLHDSSLEAPRNRREVEIVRERLHEEFFAKAYHSYFKDIAAALQETTGIENNRSLTGLFTDGCFPPFLGKFTPVTSPLYKGDVTWEIRSPNVVPAIRWVLRGLIESGHFIQTEPMTTESVQSGVIIPNNVYYIDPRVSPVDVLHQKEIQRRKRANQDEFDEEEQEQIELSEYEKRRAERVARNADRLKSLGLG